MHKSEEGDRETKQIVLLPLLLRREQSHKKREKCILDCHNTCDDEAEKKYWSSVVKYEICGVSDVTWFLKVTAVSNSVSTI